MKNITVPFKTDDPEIRVIIDAVVLRDRRICQMCGATEADECPYEKRLISLHVTVILELNIGGRIEVDNLRTVCSTCASGLQAIKERELRLGRALSAAKPNRIELLTQLRRATINDQKAVLEWLLRKFQLRVATEE